MLELTEKGKTFDGAHFLYTTDISTNFNAESYNEKGFLDAISPNDDIFMVDPTAH